MSPARANRAGTSRRFAYVRGALIVPVLVAALSGCAPELARPLPVAPAPAPAPALPPAPPPAPVLVMAVGDSITEADSPDFDGGTMGPLSWAAHAGGAGMTILGGCAHSGETTEQLLSRIRDGCGGPVRARRTDVLVLMAGTNDVSRGIPDDAATANLQQIAALVGADRVVLSTIPPLDARGEDARRYNAALATLADQERWRLVDPMLAVRDEAGHFRPGMITDGIHPTEAAAALIGNGLRPALRR